MNVTPGCCKAHCRYRVVMIRHGESEWNMKNLFCGWVDVNLSVKGEQEAITAGQAIKKEKIHFDIAFTSVLKRANQTLDYILKEIGQTDLEVVKSWRLNERHYGALTGLNKVETAEKFGEEQVKIWRRSYDKPPPEMGEDHPHYKEIVEDPIYADGPALNEFPKFESLKLTSERTLPFWNERIVPAIKANKTVLIVAHGNSLRGIIKHIEGINEKDIVDLDLPTGIPFVYTLNASLEPVHDKLYLGDPAVIRAATEKVKDQGKIRK